MKIGRVKRVRRVWLGAAAMCAVAASAVAVMSYVEERSLVQSIAGKILRFHVIANSDSDEDQDIKYKVRDAVGAYMQELLSSAENEAECEAIVAMNAGQIEAYAEDTVRDCGADYGVTVELADVDFPEKSYGEYVFPEGNYRALRITLGEGAGQNWWCVMYPNMCFAGSVYEAVSDDADEALREVLSADEYRKIIFSGEYEIRSGALDFLYRLKNRYYEKTS
jgi:stage II sporulation protein R